MRLDPAPRLLSSPAVASSPHLINGRHRRHCDEAPGEALSVPPPHTNADITLERYLWARSVLWSRQCELTTSQGRMRAVAPGFDMFNHSFDVTPGTCFKLNAEEDALCVVATQDYKEGEQVERPIQ